MTVQEIKTYLKEKKITYEELAEKTGLSISTIKKIFSGISKFPRVDTMEAIERALGLSSELTPEERAAGLGNHPTNLSAKEWEWLEIGSEILRVQGEEKFELIKSLLKKLYE